MAPSIETASVAFETVTLGDQKTPPRLVDCGIYLGPRHGASHAAWLLGPFSSLQHPPLRIRQALAVSCGGEDRRRDRRRVVTRGWGGNRAVSPDAHLPQESSKHWDRDLICWYAAGLGEVRRSPLFLKRLRCLHCSCCCKIDQNGIRRSVSIQKNTIIHFEAASQGSTSAYAYPTHA